MSPASGIDSLEEELRKVSTSGSSSGDSTGKKDTRPKATGLPAIAESPHVAESVQPAVEPVAPLVEEEPEDPRERLIATMRETGVPEHLIQAVDVDYCARISGAL